jgi:hypothetical protein
VQAVSEVPVERCPNSRVIIMKIPQKGIARCSSVWWPPPKYRDKEACNQDAYLDTDV